MLSTDLICRIKVNDAQTVGHEDLEHRTIARFVLGERYFTGPSRLAASVIFEEQAYHVKNRLLLPIQHLRS